MTPAALAWRSLSRQPARAWLGIAGVAAVGALLFDMLLLSRGLLVSFADLLEQTGYDVRVTATDAIPGFGPAIDRATQRAAELRRVPGVARVVPLVFGRAQLRHGDGAPPEDIFFTGSGAAGEGGWQLVEGRPLSFGDDPGPAPVVVNRELARRQGVGPGDTLTLAAVSSYSTALPRMEFRVTGIADFLYESAGQMSAVTTLAAYYRAQGTPERDGADLLLVASRPGVASVDTIAAIRDAAPDLNAFTNAALVTRFRNTDFSYFRQISFVLSSITLFFAFVLVGTLLTVSVNQRFGEIAGLRAIGFSRRRVAADLLWESALLVGSGGLLALPLGFALAEVLDRILHGMPGFPQRLDFFVFHPRAALLYVLLLSLTALLAALYPVYVVARLPIAATLRNEAVS